MAKMVLPPGFRFHPTDVELVMYYLKRKTLGRKLIFEAIAEINIYKYSPWDLPGQSFLKNKDLEWYFFCPVERKYGSGLRSNRATECGYWKSTGKDRPVLYNEHTVGMVKTLVFHQGHAPKGDRTDWVMHEYRILNKELSEAGDVQPDYVLSKVFKKSGPGPKNGAQYGAPFNEQEWDIDDYDKDDGMCAELLLPSQSLPLSGVANANSNSIGTSTFVQGSTSTESLLPAESLPLSAVAPNYNNSIVTGPFFQASTSAEPALPYDSLPLSDVAHNYNNSVVTSPFFQGSSRAESVLPYESLPLSDVAHTVGNSVVTSAFFRGTIPRESVLPSESLPLSAATHSNGCHVFQRNFFQGSTSTVPLFESVPARAMPSSEVAPPPAREDAELESMLAMFTEHETPLLNGQNEFDQVENEGYMELGDIYGNLEDLGNLDELLKGLQ